MRTRRLIEDLTEKEKQEIYSLYVQNPMLSYKMIGLRKNLSESSICKIVNEIREQKQSPEP